MEVVDTEIPEVKLIHPKVFGDERGFFFESYQIEKYQKAGIQFPFVQDNVSFSSKGVLRGLHFQHPVNQRKLVGVLQGSVFDVAVDIRKGSPTFGKWVGFELNSEKKNQLWIPRGFAHGFQVLSETALFVYKCDNTYSPETDHSLIWNDPDLGINWPLENPSLSQKDQKGLRLQDIPEKDLPSYKDFQ